MDVDAAAVVVANDIGSEVIANISHDRRMHCKSNEIFYFFLRACVCVFLIVPDSALHSIAYKCSNVSIACATMATYGFIIL